VNDLHRLPQPKRIVVRTREMGTVEAREDRLLEFAVPILGFESYRRFVILPEPSAPPFHWLQSADEPELAFPVVRAADMGMIYTAETPGLRPLGARRWSEVEPWIIVVIPEGGDGLRMNFSAPIAVNQRTGLAGQIVVGETPVVEQQAVGAAAW